jgi:hypothetical protein
MMSNSLDEDNFKNDGDSEVIVASRRDPQNDKNQNKDCRLDVTALPTIVDYNAPVMRTIQDPGSGRYLFLCNQQKIYSWDQNLEEVNLYIPAPPNYEASSFDIRIEAQRLRVGIKGHDRYFIDEATFSKVDTNESSWYLDEDEKEIHIVLIKVHRGQVWDIVLKGIYNAETGNSESDKIDPIIQQKMRKDLLLERFQEEHPGFDFRGADFNGNIPDPRSFLGGVRYS